MAPSQSPWEDEKTMQWKIEKHLILWGLMAAA